MFGPGFAAIPGGYNEGAVGFWKTRELEDSNAALQLLGQFAQQNLPALSAGGAIPGAMPGMGGGPPGMGPGAPGGGGAIPPAMGPRPATLPGFGGPSSPGFTAIPTGDGSGYVDLTRDATPGFSNPSMVAGQPQNATGPIIPPGGFNAQAQRPLPPGQPAPMGPQAGMPRVMGQPQPGMAPPGAGGPPGGPGATPSMPPGEFNALIAGRRPPGAGTPSPGGPGPAPGTGAPGMAAGPGGGLLPTIARELPARVGPPPPGGYDWRTLAAELARTNPQAPPEVIGRAIIMLAPLMNHAGQADMRILQAQLAQERINTMRERHELDERKFEETKKEHEIKHEENERKAEDREFGLGLAEERLGITKERHKALSEFAQKRLDMADRKLIEQKQARLDRAQAAAERLKAGSTDKERADALREWKQASEDYHRTVRERIGAQGIMDRTTKANVDRELKAQEDADLHAMQQAEARYKGFAKPPPPRGALPSGTVTTPNPEPETPAPSRRRSEAPPAATPEGPAAGTALGRIGDAFRDLGNVTVPGMSPPATPGGPTPGLGAGPAAAQPAAPTGAQPPAARPLIPIPEADLAGIKALIAGNPSQRLRILEMLQTKGYDTSGL